MSARTPIDTERAVIAAYVAGTTNREIAAAHGLSVNRIPKIVRRNGVASRRDNQHARMSVIVDAYRIAGNASAVARSYGVTTATVISAVRAAGVVVMPRGEVLRKHSVDHGFFAGLTERTDDAAEEAAYWCGFLLADGCITDIPNRSPVVRLRLAAYDAGHIEAFKRAVRTTAKTSMARDGSHASVAVHSRRMARDLAVLGVTPRKSFTATPPVISDRLVRHLFRGLVDGDGTIGKPNKPCVGLCGTRMVCDAFATWAGGVCGRTPAVRPRGKIWYTGVTGRVNAAAVAERLYGECTVALTRKHERAMALMALVAATKDGDQRHRVRAPKAPRRRRCR